jgi:diguanylate cyclase (GGDEF)-like protein
VRSIQYGRLVVAVCGLLLMIATAAVIFGVHRIHELAKNQEAVGDQLFAARRVYETLLSMESSQRGFLLTDDPAYLEPYRRGSGEIDGAISDFKALFRDEEAASATVNVILDLAQAKRAELAQTIALAGSGRRDAALDVVKGNRGQQQMDELRIKLLSLIAQQRAVRTNFLDQAELTLRLLYLIGASVAVLIMVVVVVAIRSLSVSVTRLHEAQQAEEHNAMHDALTGLPNRRYLTEWLMLALAGAERANRNVHLLYLDLDGFKEVNDRFGHDAGDRVLQVTASRLRETMRASDFVARLGGDEFVVVLPETGEAPATASVIERIEQQLRIAPIRELANGMVTASIGQAYFPRDGHDLASLLAVADRAMYRAKVSRRQIHSPDAPAQWIGGPSEQSHGT